MNGMDNSELNTDENIILDELPIDKLYENFSLQASDLCEVMDSFEVLKRKLDIEKLHGLELYRELKAKLGARNSKAWKAREVLNMLEKRANQKEYMEQVRLSMCVRSLLCRIMHSDECHYLTALFCMRFRNMSQGADTMARGVGAVSPQVCMIQKSYLSIVVPNNIHCAFCNYLLYIQCIHC